MAWFIMHSLHPRHSVGADARRKTVPHCLVFNYGWVLRRDAIAGRHLWRGAPPFNIDTFVSDALMERIRAAKLKGLRAKPTRAGSAVSDSGAGSRPV